MSVSRNYLISYDISDDKRRRKVFEFLLGQGDHVQYSVFIAQLDLRELAEMRTILGDFIHHKEDQVILLDMGPASNALEKSLEVVGKPLALNPCVIVI